MDIYLFQKMLIMPLAPGYSISSSTSITELQNNEPIIVYPNPTSGVINIDADIKTIEIFNVLGKKYLPLQILIIYIKTNSIYLIYPKEYILQNLMVAIFFKQQKLSFSNSISLICFYFL